MTDEQIEKLAALLESLGSQEVTSTSGVLQSELFAAASAIRQLMREREEADEFIRSLIHPNHLCERFMSNPPICTKSYAAQKFLGKRLPR